MAILKKKPIQQAAAKQATRPVTGKPQRPAPPPVEDDDEEPVTEEDFEENEEDQEEETTTPPRVMKGQKAASGNSRADAFDSVAASNDATDVPPGKYEAIVRSAVLQEPDQKGQSARFAFELCSPEFGDNNSVTTWFKLFNEKGERSDGGIRAFKGTMAKLGYETTFDTLEEALAEVTKEMPGIILKISYSQDRNDKGVQWIRPVVDSLCDNDVIQEYKDNVAY